MSISPSLFGTLWTASYLGWGALTYQFLKQLRREHSNLAQEIRLFNSRYGLDLSVDKEDLAMDLMVPGRGRNLKKIAEANGKDFDQYRMDLTDVVGKSHSFWAFGFHILGVAFTISGITYLFPGGFISPATYLAMVYLCFVLSLIGFLFVYGRNFV